jgi:hypothetical protein
MSSDTGIFIKENSFIPEAYVLCGDTDPQKSHSLMITNDDAYVHFVTCPGSNLPVLMVKPGQTATLSLPYSVGNRYSLQSPNFGTMRCVIEVVGNISTAVTTVKRYFPTKKDKERENAAITQNENTDRLSNSIAVMGASVPNPAACVANTVGYPDPNTSKQVSPLKVLTLHKPLSTPPRTSGHDNMPLACASYVTSKPAPSSAVAALAMHTTNWKQNSADSIASRGDGYDAYHSFGRSSPDSSVDNSPPSSRAFKNGDGSGSDDEKQYFLAQRKSPGRGGVTLAAGDASRSRTLDDAIISIGTLNDVRFSYSDMEGESAVYDADAYEASPQRRHRIHDFYPDLPVPPSSKSMSLLGVPLANPLHDSLSSLGGKLGRERRRVVRIQVQDFDFVDRSVNVHLGDTLEFGLHSDVPRHAEHVFEGKSLERELCFEGPLLQQGERTTFRFTPLVPGEIVVSCKIYTDCTTTIFVEPLVAELNDSLPSIELQSQHSTVGTGMLSRSVLSPTSKRSQRKKVTTQDPAGATTREEDTSGTDEPSSNNKRTSASCNAPQEITPTRMFSTSEQEKSLSVRLDQSSPVGLPVCESVLGTSLKFLTTNASAGANAAQNCGGYSTDHSISSFYDSDDHISGSGTDTGIASEHQKGDALQGSRLMSKDSAMKLPVATHKGAKLYGSFVFSDAISSSLKNGCEEELNAVSSSKISLCSENGVSPNCEIWVSCYRFTPPVVTLTLPAPGDTKSAGVVVRFVAHAGVNKIGSQTSFKLCCEEDDSGHRCFDAVTISNSPNGRPFFDHCFHAPGDYVVSDIVFPFMKCTVQVRPSSAMSSGCIAARTSTSPGLVGSFPLTLAPNIFSAEHQQHRQTDAGMAQLDSEDKKSVPQDLSQAKKKRNRKKLLKIAYQEKKRLALPHQEETANETKLQSICDEDLQALTHDPRTFASNTHEQGDVELNESDDEVKREQRRRENRACNIVISPITRRLHARAVADYLESDSDTDTSKDVGTTDVTVFGILAIDHQINDGTVVDCSSSLQSHDAKLITAEINGSFGVQADQLVATLDSSSSKECPVASATATFNALAPKPVQVGKLSRKLWADYSDSDDSDADKGSASLVLVTTNRADGGFAVNACKKSTVNGVASSSSAAKRAGIPIPARRAPSSTLSNGNLYAAPESHSNIRVKPAAPSPSSSPAPLLGVCEETSSHGLKRQKSRKSLGGDIAVVLSSNLPVPMSLSDVRTNQLAHAAGGSKRGALRNNAKNSGQPGTNSVLQSSRDSLNDIASAENPIKKARANQRLNVQRVASSAGHGTGSERERESEKSTCSEKDKAGTGSERDGGAPSERDGMCAETKSDKSKGRKSRSTRKGSQVNTSLSLLTQDDRVGSSPEDKSLSYARDSPESAGTVRATQFTDDVLAESCEHELLASEGHVEEKSSSYMVCEQSQEFLDAECPTHSPLSPDEDFLWQRWLAMETLIISGQKDTLRSGRQVAIATLLG